MSHLRTVYLHGVLGERFGPEHRFALSTPREAISALSANFEGFRRAFLEVPHYGIVCDGDCRYPGNCPDIANSPISRDIHLVPQIEGRFGALLTPLLVPIVGTVAAPIISGLLTVGLLFGISLLFAPKPPDTDTEKDENYIFAGPENVTTQGAPVPLIYGRCFVGSVVASAGIEVGQGAGSGDGEGRNYTWTSQSSVSVFGRSAAPVLGASVNIHIPPEPYREREIVERPPPWRPINA